MGSVTRHWGNTNRANTRIYKIWSKMKDRCTNPNNQYYHRYGGRGIHYWYTWQSFEVFAVWAFSNGYEEHLTLDRIDNDGDYTPFNCRWVTTREQNRNTSRVRYIEYQGKTQLISDWARELGITPATFHKRMLKDPNNKDRWFRPKEMRYDTNGKCKCSCR